MKDNVFKAHGFTVRTSLDRCKNCDSTRNRRSVRKYKKVDGVDILIGCSDCRPKVRKIEYLSISIKGACGERAQLLMWVSYYTKFYDSGCNPEATQSNNYIARKYYGFTFVFYSNNNMRGGNNLRHILCYI